MSTERGIIITKNTCNGNNDHSTSNNLPDSTTIANDEERSSCKFGKQCNRKNPQHRIDMAHPGDKDYIVPDMPDSRENAPKCQYGRKCYRLNPDHFRDFSHPRNINIQSNYRKYVLKKPNGRRNSDSSFDYDCSEDPFADDSGSNYSPSEDEE